MPMLPTLVRWDPVRDLAAMRSDMQTLLNRMLEGDGAGIAPAWTPHADVIERDDEIVIVAELPGVKDDDIEITVQDGMLRLSGERRMEEKIEDGRFHRIERSYGRFERIFPLPPGVREDDIHAAVAYGVLRIRIPKPSQNEPRRISVSSGNGASADRPAASGEAGPAPAQS